VDIEENVKSVALGFFQSSKTIRQDLSVKSKLSTPLRTLLEVLVKKLDKKLLILRVQS